MLGSFRNLMRFVLTRHFSNGLDVSGSGPATTTDDIHKAMLKKILNHLRHLFRRLIIFPHFIRQTRIRMRRHEKR